MVVTLALAAGFLGAVAALLAAGWAAGGLAPALATGSRALDHALRLATGMAMQFFVCSVLGVLGLLWWPVALGVFLLAGAAGIWRRPPGPLPRLPWPAVGVLAIPAYLVLAGSLVPDMTQDSMWYHLSVPGQWALTGRLDAFPSVFPSAYPLAVESLYAVLIPVGGEVLCSAFYGAGAVVLWLLILATAARVAGRGAAAAAGALWIPLLATFTLAPVPAGNDAIAGLLLFAGLVVLVLPVATGGEDRAGGWLLGGFILGQALAAKPICIGYMPGLLAVAAISRRHPTHAVKFAVLAGSAILASYAPWGVRGLLTSGVPLFPLGAGLFPVAEPFQPTLAASKSLNALHEVSAPGIAAALTSGLFSKVRLALRSGDALYLLAPLVAITGAVVLPGRQRLWPLAMAAMMAPGIMIKGANEILRYASLCYPVGGVVLAACFVRVGPMLKPRARVAVAVLLGAAALGDYLSQQHRTASFRTVLWPYRPLLTETDRLAFAGRAEFGGAYLYLREVAKEIPVGDRVFLPDSPAPYYLGRRALWNDFSVLKGGVAERWRNFTAEEALAFLQEEELRWIVFSSSDLAGPVEALVATGTLREVPRSPLWGSVRLYRVETQAPASGSGSASP